MIKLKLSYTMFSLTSESFKIIKVHVNTIEAINFNEDLKANGFLENNHLFVYQHLRLHKIGII